MTRSLYIVMPEATRQRQRIRDLMQNAGLTIVKDSRHNVTGDMVTIMHPDLPLGLATAARAHLVRERCEFVIVEGPNPTETMRRIVGREANPAECAPGSLRRRFGIIAPVSTIDGLYYKNAIYYPESQEQADKLLALL